MKSRPWDYFLSLALVPGSSNNTIRIEVTSKGATQLVFDYFKLFPKNDPSNHIWSFGEDAPGYIGFRAKFHPDQEYGESMWPDQTYCESKSGGQIENYETYPVKIDEEGVLQTVKEGQEPNLPALIFGECETYIPRVVEITFDLPE